MLWFPKRRFMKRIALGSFRIILVAILIVYVLVPLIFKYTYGLQRSMVFLNFVRWPRNADYNSPHLYGISGTRNLYVTTNEDVTLGVWHTLPVSMENDNISDVGYEEALSHGEPVILYMHGNSGSRASPHRVELYNVLKNLNYHVVSFDYRSYADSSDVEPTEDGVVSDGKFMYRWLEKRVKSAPLIVWGHSLGTGVSSHVLADLAKEGTQVKALVLESPFNNLGDEIREHPFATIFRRLPWFEVCFIQPVSANKLRFVTDSHISNFLAPVLILHAKDDLVVPFILGQRLLKAALETRPRGSGRVNFVSFDGKHRYGHKLICRAPELPSIITDFINESLRMNM